MADLGEEAFSSQMKVVATFLRLLEELMRNKQQDLRYGTKTQRRGILGRMKDFVGGIFKKVYDLFQSADIFSGTTVTALKCWNDHR